MVIYTTSAFAYALGQFRITKKHKSINTENIEKNMRNLMFLKCFLGFLLVFSVHSVS
jgi:hypothetical protein